MRILFLIDGLHRGGKERRVVQLIKGLNEKGYNDLYMISSLDSITYEEIYDYHINISIISRKEKKFFPRLIKKINEISPDIIQTWSLISSFHYNCIRFLCKKRPKYICSYISDCNYSHIPIKKKLTVLSSHLLADAITGNSMAGLKSYKAPSKKSLCLYNGFDFERTLVKYDLKEIKDKYHISTNKVVSMFARMQYHKDYHTFILAAKMILEKNDDVTFLCVGGGPMYDSINAMVENPFKDKILLLGQIDNVDELISITDISVLCTNSNKHKEGISNSILESLAFGKPVIATRGGGTDEIIRDGINGFLIEPNNSIVLRDKLSVLLQNTQLQLDFKKNAIEFARNNFSLEKSSTQYIDLYESLS